jgi:hypothetical protein
MRNDFIQMKRVVFRFRARVASLFTGAGGHWAHLDTVTNKVASLRKERRIYPAGHSILQTRCRINAAFPSLCPVAPVVTLVPQNFKAQHGNLDWEKSVEDNARFGRTTHALKQSGYHTLKIWMVDPGVVVQKLVVDLGGVRPSYLGPPESYRRPSTK